MPAVVSCAIVVGTIRNVIRDQRSSRRLVLPFRKLIRPPSLASHNVVVYLPSVLRRCAAPLAARRNVYSTQGKLRQTRSEERRVGKERRSWRSPVHQKVTWSTHP